MADICGLVANYKYQSHKQGGFEGTPSLAFYTPLNCHILIVLPLEIDPLASMLLRIAIVQTSLVAARA